jgi:competence ComEA-like helix-hairpin-helix protein
MAIIPLRQYNREIEGLIDTGQLDEAAAHCRHILESFPKHIATYRLLGKAYLEQRRYGDAADILQRVLSSVPDDYVSNIGMSIIREDEGNLDAAIWYMERASEAQPSNTAIKDELRRLYGRRDGIEPPKIRLTRGALARMYSKGGLFDQAIAELRAALAEDPQRPDLLVMLAQMYFHLGQQVEAVDTCGSLIKRLPYCLIANRILAAILPRTERADDTKTYLQRSIAMDPYFASAAPNALTAESVPESAINIERLAYRPGMQAEGPSQPAWAASLGISLEENQVEQLPDWLQDQNAPMSIPPSDNLPPPTAPFSWEQPDIEESQSGTNLSQEDAIPDWLKEAGWQPSTGAATGGPGLIDYDQSIDQSQGEIAKADIPDWLKGLVPSGVFDEEQPPIESKPEDVDLPWLHQTPPGATDTIVNWLGTKKATAPEISEPETTEQGGIDDRQDEIPDWLRDFQEPKPSGDISTSQAAPVISSDDTSLAAVSPDKGAQKQEKPGEENGLPEWLRGVESSYGRSGITDWLNRATVDKIEAAAHDKTPLDEEEPPEWLKDFGKPAPEIAEPIPTETSIEEQALPAEELPDWQIEMGKPAADTGEFAPPATTAEMPAQPAGLSDQDTALAWLESLAAQHGASEEELITQPDKRLEAMPDWIQREAEEKQPEDEAPTQPVVVEQFPKPDAEFIAQSEVLAEPALEVAEPVVDEAALVVEELPDWLKELGETAPKIAELGTIELAAEEPTLPGAELPDWLKEMGEPAAEIPELGEAEPAAEEPALPAEESPDWLKEMGEPSPEIPELGEVEPAAEEPALPVVELPDWLKEMSEPTPEIPELGEAEPAAEEPALPVVELPDWLKEMGEPAPEIPELAEAEPAVEEPALPAVELPDWLKEMGKPAPEISELVEAEPAAEEPAMPAEELPDWLKEMGEPAPEISELVEVEPAAEEPALPAVELPDWLKEMGEPAAEIREDIPPQSVVEVPAQPMELSDQDVALAWLESLAAQHGASEEELITKPGERLEAMPDWVQREAEVIAPEDETPTQPVIVEQPRQPEAELLAPTEEILEPKLESTEPAADEAALPAEELPDWLKDFGEPVPEAVEAVAEDISLPTAELPDWLLELTERDQATAEPEREEPTPTAEELPDWLAETTIKAGTANEDETSELLPARSDSDELPEWLAESATPELEQAGELDELPDWLKEIPQAETDEIETYTGKAAPVAPAWMPEAILPETPQAAEAGPVLEAPGIPVEVEPEISQPELTPAPGEPLSEPVNINTASLAELEQLPGVGFVLAQNIIAHRETYGPFTTVDELGKVSGFELPLLGELGDRLITGIPQTMEEAVPEIETEDTIFTAARQAVDDGEAQLAADLYNRLVAQGSNLDQVIADMKNALYRYPLDINFWQILGDAYIRTDQLQEALDAYTEAEELLR